MDVRVECYSGYKANERPLRFHVGDRALEVKELLDRWYGEDYDYFKLLADDENTYILKYHRIEDRWELTLLSTPRVSSLYNKNVVDFDHFYRKKRQSSDPS